MTDTQQIRAAENTAAKQHKKVVGRPFSKGVSGNPKGKPKGSFSLKTLLVREIKKRPKGEQMTYAMALIKRQLRQAIVDGDQVTQKLIWNYIEGLPEGASMAVGPDGEPTEVSRKLTPGQEKAIANGIVTLFERIMR